MKQLLVALLAASACHSDPQPAKPTPSGPRDKLDAELAVVVTAAIALEHEVTASSADCAKVAALFRRFGAEHAAKLADLGELRAQLGADEREKYDVDHDDDARTLGSPVEAAMLSCHDDQSVIDAIATAGFGKRR